MGRGATPEPDPGLARFCCNGAAGEGHLVNVSETGVFIETDRPPQSGEVVQIELPGLHGPVSLRGRVRFVGSREDGTHGFSAQLIHPSPDYLELLESLEIADRRADPRLPQRVAPRVLVSVPVSAEHGSMHDIGVLCDISQSGARIENTGLKPADGCQVTLRFALRGYTQTFEVLARVTRATESGGYAVRFEQLDPVLEQALLTGEVRKRELGSAD